MTIVTEIGKILKTSKHLSELETEMMSLMSKVFTESLAHCLERLDKELISDYLVRGWEIDRIESRQVTFLFGEVSFKRHRLRKEGEKSFLPLDKALGLEARQRYSPSFMEKVSLLATGMTFRQASASLELLTGRTMSHQTIHGITQRVAEAIGKSELPPSEELRKPKVLYIEGDGVWIGSQSKGKHHEFKRGFIHEGVDRTGKRGQLINPVYFGCLGTSRDLFQEIGDYLQTHYDLRETIIIANSDGGSGYEASKFEEMLGRYKSFNYCLDSYHVMRYITGKLGFDKRLQKSIRQAVKDYDKSELELLLDTAESCLEDDKQLEKLLAVKSYLLSHWEGIKPLQLRHLGVSDGVGVCESGHRFYTNRLKRQGRNWTKSGAESMVILMTAQRNGLFELYYRNSYPFRTFSPEIKINMRKLLQKGQHDQHVIPSATIPLNGATSSPIGQMKKWI